MLIKADQLNTALTHLWQNIDETGRGWLQHICNLLELPVMGSFEKPIFDISEIDLQQKNYTISVTDYVKVARTQISAILELTAWFKDFYNKEVEERPDFKLEVFEKVDKVRNNAATILLETTMDYKNGIPQTYWNELSTFIDETRAAAETDFSTPGITLYSSMGRVAVVYYGNQLKHYITLLENTAMKVRN